MLDGEILDVHVGEVTMMITEGREWKEKTKKCSVGAVWRDEMKPAFGLFKVGMTWCQKDEVLLMNYWGNKGTFADPWAVCVVPDRQFGEWFIRLCMYDFAIGNGDRHSGNILIINEHSFVPIDEAMKVRPANEWSMVFNDTGKAKVQKAFEAMQIDRHWLHRFVGEEINDGLPKVLWTRDKYSIYITVEEYKHLDLTLPMLLRGETEWLDKTFRLIGVEVK